MIHTYIFFKRKKNVYIIFEFQVRSACVLPVECNCVQNGFYFIIDSLPGKYSYIRNILIHVYTRILLDLLIVIGPKVGLPCCFFGLDTYR